MFACLEHWLVDIVLRLGGLLFFLGILFMHVHFFYSLLLQGKKKLKKRKEGARWAVVTGASDGIGKEFCLQLAKSGYNICLLSRTKAKLDAVAETCRESKVETKVIPVDFSAPPATYYDRVVEEIGSIDVDILVNNVGVSFQYPEQFLKTDPALDDSILNINIQATLKMTRIVMPGMVERKHGYVFNMGSFSGDVPVPLLSTYSSSKSFVDFFSQCLQEEYAKDGIVVKCCTPMFVATEMAKMRPSLTVPKPERLVKDILAHTSGPVTFSPYWVHHLMSTLLKAIPDKFRTPYLHKMNRQIRGRALRKLEKTK